MRYLDTTPLHFVRSPRAEFPRDRLNHPKKIMEFRLQAAPHNAEATAKPIMDSRCTSVGPIRLASQLVSGHHDAKCQRVARGDPLDVVW